MSIAHLPGRAIRPRRSDVVELVSHLPSDRLSVAAELLTDMLAHEQSGTRNLTASELSALGRLGLSETDILEPTNLSAVARGRMREQELKQCGYTVSEAAAILGVTAARVRQRCSDGSLVAQRQSGGWFIPALQFPHGRPLHGWAHVARAIPRDTPLLVLERALDTPSPQLRVEGEDLTPSQWLEQGGDPAPAATALTDALERLP